MTLTLTAAPRTEQGRQAKQVRDAGRIPGVVYGRGVPPQSVSFAASEFQKVYRQAGMSSLVDVVIGGAAPVKALIQEVQVHPLTMRPSHVDMRQIRMDEKLTVQVPLVFVGEAPAVKESAGTLVHAYDAVTVTCLPADLPHEIQVDLGSLKTFDDALTVADLKLPQGVTVVEEPTVTLATVTAPLTEEQLKKMEEASQVDVTAVKTEAEVKKEAEEEAAKAEGEAEGAAPQA